MTVLNSHIIYIYIYICTQCHDNYAYYIIINQTAVIEGSSGNGM